MIPTKGDEVRCIMKRTIANLEFIERHQNEPDVYEVTQLVNSFLGALAHPWERHKSQLENLPLNDPANAIWLGIKDELTCVRTPKTVLEQVTRLRHAFAHGNIEFLSAPDGNISELVLWNTPKGSKARNWQARLGIDHLRDVLTGLAAIANSSQ